jgi:hypothetical protein
MEILRFEEATPTAPKRKKSSKGYLAVGFVATIFGLGSAFASSTITINSSVPIALGQGVSLVAACDDQMRINPSTSMEVVDTEPTFYLTSLEILDVNGATATAASNGLGCAGKYFDLQLFSATSTAYTCTQLLQPDPTILPTVSYADVVTSGTKTSTCGSSKLSFQVPSKVIGDWDFTIPFTKAPSDISYITLVSRG